MLLDLVKTKMKMLYMASARKEIDNVIRDAIDSNSDYVQFLDALLEIELSSRQIKRIDRRTKDAKLPVLKSIADFDFSIRDGLNKHQILSFCDCSFIKKNENIIFVGNPGVGKTHLAIAIAYEACRKDHKVMFTTGAKLINNLREAYNEKTLNNFIKNTKRLDLVVIDEVGYFPYEKESSELFFQFISEWYETGSIIITTNLPFSKWNEIFCTERLTTAILDRVIHHGNIIEIIGESYRFSSKVENDLNTKRKIKKS